MIFTHLKEEQFRTDRAIYSINKISFSCSNTGAIKGDPYWTCRKNSLHLIKLSSINELSNR